MFGNTASLRCTAFFVLLFTFPYISGMLNLVENARASWAPPISENLAYELQTNSALNALAVGQLKKDPTKIFEWVRREVAYEPYAGTRQGAMATYLARRGNALDKSLLLAQLMAEASIPWRLATGDVRMSVADAQSWLGFDAADRASRYLQAAGVSHSLQPSAQQPKDLLLRGHHWIQIRSDFFPLHGSAADDSGRNDTTAKDPAEVWVDLDPTVTFSEMPAKFDLQAIAGVTAADLRALVTPDTESLGDHSLMLSGLPIPTILRRAEQAADSVESSLSQRGATIADMLHGTGARSLSEREILPGNMIGEPVGSIRSYAPNDAESLIRYLRSQREQVTIRLRSNGTVYSWNQMGVGRTAGRSLVLNFQVTLDDAAHDVSGTYGNAPAVPLFDPTAAPNTPVARVKPLLQLNGMPLNTQLSSGYDYGMGLSLEVELKGPGSSAQTSRIPVTAGGVYSLSLVDTLSTRSVQDQVDDLGASTSSHAVYSGMLRSVSEGILHQRKALGGAALVALGHVAVEPLSRVAVASLEPAVSGGEASGVRLATWGSDDLAPTVERTEGAVSGTIAGYVQELVEDVALTGALSTMAGHDGYQSAGRLLAITKQGEGGEISQSYRAFASGAEVPAIANELPGQAGGLTQELAGVVRRSDGLLTDKEIFASPSAGTPQLRPGIGFAVWRAGRLQLRAWAAEDLKPIGAWTPLELAAGEGGTQPLVFPMQLVVSSAGGEIGLSSGSDPMNSGALALKGRAVEWLNGVLGTSLALQPAMASSSLLAAGWLADSHDDSAGWLPGLPLSAAVFQRNAAVYTKPRLLEFEVDPHLVNTVPTEDELMGQSNGVDPLFAHARFSRPVRLGTIRVNPSGLPSECTEIPTVSSSDSAKAEGFFGADRLEQCLGTSGMYEVEAYGELEGGLRSETRRTNVEVDNDKPTVTLVSQSTPIEGFFNLRGTIDDKNLTRWYVSARPHLAGSGTPQPWKELTGYAGTHRILSDQQTIAPLNMLRLPELAGVGTGWNGLYDIAVTALDSAGNQTSGYVTIQVANDIFPPSLSLSATNRGEAVADSSVLYEDQSVAGPETVITVRASDLMAAHPENKGLKSLHVWAESTSDSSRRVDIDHEPLSYNSTERFQVQPAETEMTFDLRKLPRANPNDTWSIKARAEDYTGLIAERQLAKLSVGNVLWNFTVDPPAIKTGGSQYSQFSARTTKPAIAQFDVYRLDPFTQAREATPVRTTRPSGVASQEAYTSWNAMDSSNKSVAPGVYEVELTLTYALGSNDHFQEKDTRRLIVYADIASATVTGPALTRIARVTPGVEEPVQVIEFDPDQPSGEVNSDLVIEQGSADTLQVYGRIGTMAVDFLDGREPPAAIPPCNAGYPFAFWAVEFKASDAKPPISDIFSKINSYYNLTNRDNWQPIRWSTGVPNGICASGICNGDKPVFLADWDAGDLPLGYYDLRLWVTDGRAMQHKVIGGLKVIPKATGDNPAGGASTVGALTLSSSDLTVPFSGFNAEIARDYNSKEVYTPGPFGYGWKLRGISLKVDTYGSLGDIEQDEAFITLPDGREFWFANAPPEELNETTLQKNRWVNYQEYLQRPYGMRLYRPGASIAYRYQGDMAPLLVDEPIKMNQYGSGATSDEEIPRLNRLGYAAGQVAYLQTEDKTWYIFEWKTGDIIEIIHPDGQRTNFTKNATVAQTGANGAYSSEILVRDIAGRELKLIRNTNNGLIREAVDPTGNSVKYTYDERDNLKAVADRRGFKRFYIYDTDETKKFFDRNFPGHQIKFTGSNPHRIVDVRIDNDRDEKKNFETDAFPTNQSALEIPALTAALLKDENQNWPGDVSIMRFKYSGDDIVAYETGAGDVNLNYDRAEDGSGAVDIVAEDSGARQRVEYSPEGRVEKVTDVYGHTKENKYDTVTFPDEYGNPGRSISGLLTEEVDALGNVTRYGYQDTPVKRPGSFSEIFQGWLDSKLGRADCPPLYGNCTDGDYIPQDAEGYLTGAQIQPALITQAGQDAAADPISTAITYDLNPTSLSAFQPNRVVDPLNFNYVAAAGANPGTFDPLSQGNVKATTLDYNDTNGKLASIEPPQGEDFKSTTAYIGDPELLGSGQTALPDAIFAGITHPAGDAYNGKPYCVSAGGNSTFYGYRRAPAGTQGWFEEHATSSLIEGSSPERHRLGFSRMDAQGRTVASYSLENATGSIDPATIANPVEGQNGVEGLSTTTYDPEGRAVAQYSGKNATYSDYDWQGRLLRTRSVPESQDPKDVRETTYTYDDLGRQTAVETHSGDGRLLSRTGSEFRQLETGGRLEAQTDDRGFRSESTYDNGNRLVLTRRLDPNGAVLEETSYAYDALGRQTLVTSSQVGATFTEYDDFGRVAFTVQRSGSEDSEVRTEYGYDKGGRQVWARSILHGQTDAKYTVNSYDAEGRLEFVYLYRDTTTVPSEPAETDTYLAYKYDAKGRRLAERDASGQWTYTHYDTEGRVKSTILAWNPTTTPTVTDTVPGLVASFADRNLADNLRFDFAYDDQGRQTRIVKPGQQPETGSLPAEGYGEIRKVYNADGQLEFEYGPTGSDGKRTVKNYAYDADGRTATERRGTCDASLTPESHVYLATTAYTYSHEWGGVETKSISGSTGLERREVYNYDPETGDLRSVVTYAGPENTSPVLRRESYEYDRINGRLVAKISPEGRIDYGYSPTGRLNRIKTSAGADTEYVYGTFGELTEIRDRSFVSDTTREERAVTYERDALLRKTRAVYGNGASTEWAYDDAHGGFVKEITHKDRSGATLLRLTYGRDGGGLIRSVWEDRGDGDDTHWKYDYDALKRLTVAEQVAWTGAASALFAPAADGAPVSRFSYGYDRRGNRLSEERLSGPAKTWTYGFDDKMVDEFEATAKVKSYAFDGLGRLTGEFGPTGEQTRGYLWTADDRLTAATLFDLPNDPVIAYGYDHAGTRTARSALPADGETPAPQRAAVDYLQDYQNPSGYSQSLAEIDAATRETLASRLVTEDGVLAELSRHDPNSPDFDLNFLQTDHLGTTRLLTNHFGENSNAGVASYEPFGQVTSEGLGSLTNYAFTGQYREVAMGMQYHRARWLQTANGRWGSGDRLFDLEGCFSNPSAYLGPNPIGSTDLSGYAFDAVSSLAALSGLYVLEGIQFGIGNLPFGLSPSGVALGNVGFTTSQIAFLIIQYAKTVGYNIASFLPIIGSIIGIYELTGLTLLVMDAMRKGELASLPPLVKFLLFILGVALLLEIFIPNAIDRSAEIATRREIGLVLKEAAEASHSWRTPGKKALSIAKRVIRELNLPEDGLTTKDGISIRRELSPNELLALSEKNGVEYSQVIYHDGSVRLFSGDSHSVNSIGGRPIARRMHTHPGLGENASNPSWDDVETHAEHIRHHREYGSSGGGDIEIIYRRNDGHAQVFSITLKDAFEWLVSHFPDAHSYWDMMKLPKE